MASVGAAVIHFAVAPVHWNDWMPSGVFFASIAAFQLLWGLLAWSLANRLVLVAGVAANVGSAALWVISRTAGAPFGPYAGEPEAVEAAGICVLLLQCYVIMGATWALYRRCRAEEVSAIGRGLVLLGATTVMAAAVTVGLASGLLGHQHHHGAAVEAESGHGVTNEAHVDGHRHEEHAGLPDNVTTQPYGHHRESTAPPEATAVPGTPAAPAADPVHSPVLEIDGHLHDHND